MLYRLSPYIYTYTRISYLSLFDMLPILEAKVPRDSVSFIIGKEMLVLSESLASAPLHILPLFPLLRKISLG